MATPIICPQCGQPRSTSENFCGNCGYQFRGSPVTRQLQQTPIIGAFDTLIDTTLPVSPRLPSSSQQRGKIRAIVVAVLAFLLVGTLFLGMQLGKGNSQGTIGTTSTTPNPASTTLTNSIPTATPSPTPTPSPSPTPSPTPCPKPCVVYQVNWSNGANGWSGSADWKFFNGMLINDGTDNLCQGFSIEYAPTLYPPFQPQTANYAIEVEVQIVRQTHNNCSDNGFFGVGGRLSSSNGGWTGYQMVVGQGSENITDYNTRLTSGSLDPGNSWHTYRFELTGTNLKLKIDGALVIEASDAKYLDPGQLGIWSSALYLNIRSYKVIAL